MMFCIHALVVKWISRRSSEPSLGVRIPPRAPSVFAVMADWSIISVRVFLDFSISLEFDDCGYGLVVEHVLAKDEMGVRFPLPAPLDAILMDTVT